MRVLVVQSRLRSAERTVRERFVREFRAVASLNHPGIATLFEADETSEGRVYCVYEKVEGETLTERIRRGAAPAEECIEIGRQLSEALAAAHARGVVHRDIKPDNVMLTPEGRVKVLDFGLAFVNTMEPTPAIDDETIDEPLRTRAGALVGTPRYMSPEQAAGAAVDSRTDVFSAGLVLHELATGRATFTGDSVPETLHRIQVDKHLPLKTGNRSADRRLAAVVDRALAKSPDDRFASGAEMARALRAAAAPPIRRRWVRAAAALLVVGVVLGGFWWSSRPTLAFSGSDKLLIADVDNRTGDDVFDLALTAAIEIDIEQSTYARIYDRSRVAETLLMLRQPPDAVIDEKLGRDICRFAGLRAMVLPRILSAGDVFELQAVLVDPVDGSHVETLRVTAKGREEVLLSAVDELAHKIRKALGESLASIEESDLPLVQHTTSSWEALQSLVLADRRWQQGRHEESAALFERAIELDPQFMAAKGSLGLLKIQFLNEPEEGRRLLGEALALSDQVTEVERRLIRAIHEEFVVGNLEAALLEYETILGLYPDALAAMLNKGQVLLRLQRIPEAVETFEAARELEPKSARPPGSLAQIWLFVDHNAVRAEKASRELVELLGDSADARHLLAWSLVAQRRYEEAEAEMRVALELDSRHSRALHNRAHLLLLLARSAEAVSLYRELHAEAERTERENASWLSLCLALALRANGDDAGARSLLKAELEKNRRGEQPQAGLLEKAALLAASGAVDEAQRLIAGVDLSRLPAARLPQVAEVHALSGRLDDAIDVLERAVEGHYHDIYYWNIMPTLAPLRGLPRFDALTDQ